MAKVVVSCLNFHTKRHKKTVADVIDYLKKIGVRCRIVDSHGILRSNFHNTEIIITVGGDGTFLRAAHYMEKKAVICGINSDPTVKEGFFTSADDTNFKERIHMIFQGKFKTTKLTRLDVWIGNKKIEPALNEVYIGSAKPYLMSRYNIKINGCSEFQKSSGVLISTASGTYAWIGSAGGRKLPMRSQKIQYLVRDPYFGTLTPAKCLKGFMQSSEAVITPCRMDNCIVVVDCLTREYPVKAGKEITISKSPNPVNLIKFD
ncbi:NAD(+)/NADH kinase [Candidatus Woesearchaeota archaeon]|nr:NAD(+)/NADH kinase [Candidatus Woesearchaeota archaeon]